MSVESNIGKPGDCPPNAHLQARPRKDQPALACPAIALTQDSAVYFQKQNAPIHARDQTAVPDWEN